MTYKTILLAVALAAVGLAGQAHAAPFILTTTGTISSGADALGLFGPAGSSLAGDAYRLSVEYDGNGTVTTTSTLQQISGAITGPVTATVNNITTIRGAIA